VIKCGPGEAVAARNLVVRYDDFTALEGATFDVRFGEALGIIGPNGSGKSTLLKTIAGLLQPSGGDFCVLGTQPRSQRWIGPSRRPCGTSSRWVAFHD
jgi:ABC-type multidrug transport system ATPase subunit